MADNWTPRRRSVLTAAGALVGSTALPTSGSVAGRSGLDADSTAEGTVPPLEFFFPNALLDPEGQPLTDESMIAVEAEPTAEFADAPERWKTGTYDKGYEGDGVWTDYPTTRRSRSSPSMIGSRAPSSGSARSWCPTAPSGTPATPSSC